MPQSILNSEEDWKHIITFLSIHPSSILNSEEDWKCGSFSNVILSKKLLKLRRGLKVAHALAKVCKLVLS